MSNRNNEYKITHLKLGASTQQYLKSLQMIFIREDLNYAIHQIELSDFIFTIDNLSKQLKNRVQFGIVGKHASHPRAQNTIFYQSVKVRPVQELWEAQYLCTCQGQHPLSG
jgi:hypothetical protein